MPAGIVHRHTATILTSVHSHQVKWDASKDESLWKILSGVAKTEIDCEHFCPGLAVLLDLEPITY